MFKKSTHYMAVALALLASNVFADKVCVVDVARLANDSAPAKRANAELDKKFMTRQKELEAAGKKFDAQVAEYEKNAVTLSESARRAKERDFKAQGTELQRKEQEFREDVDLAKKEAYKSLQDVTMIAVKKVAAERKCDVVLQDAVFTSPSADINDDVIKALADK